MEFSKINSTSTLSLVSYCRSEKPQLGPGRETFSTAPTARSTCPGFRIPGYVDFPNPAFASSGTLPSRRPVERLRPGSVGCFPRASRPFSTPKSRLRGTRSRVTPVLGLPPFCDRIRSGSVGCFPRTSRPFSTPKSRFHESRSRVTRYLVFSRSVSGFGALRSACFPRSLRPVRLPPTSRTPLARCPVLGLVPLSGRIRIGSVGCFPRSSRSFRLPSSSPAPFSRDRLLDLLPFAERMQTGYRVSPVFTASSTAVEFARPAFAFLATWPSHRSWDGSGLFRFSVSALTSIPCYGTLGGCTDTVSVLRRVRSSG